MQRLLTLLLAAIAWLALAMPAAADERILSYDTDLALAADGTLTVTETIWVRAENQQIRRGIYRDIPTRYADRLGRSVKTGFTFIDARRDGQDEPAKIERLSNGVRIRIGDPDVIIPTGRHVYRIRYQVRRAVGFFEGYDELYWNTTGTDWVFPIDKASATIRLPSNAPFTQSAAYTGEFGASGTHAKVVLQEPGLIRFETTRGLWPRTGLTVAAGFPKGVIAPPSEAEQLKRGIADWAPLLSAIGGLLLIIGYYVHAWRKAGRDPKPGTIVPLFAPPDNLSPAAIRYVLKKRMDHRGFAAALVDAAVRGHVTLTEEGGGVFAKGKMRIRRQKRPDATPLSQPEERMLARLASEDSSILMDNENHEEFSSAMSALAGPYSLQFEGKAFHHNFDWAFAGLLALAAALALVAASIAWSEDLVSPVTLLLTVTLWVIAALLYMGAPEKGYAFRLPVLILAGICGISGALLALSMLPVVAMGGGLPMVMLVLIPGVAIVISGFFWMSAPTVEGRALLDRIAGFKMFLSTTEGERFNRMQGKGQDLKLFERFLPYAIALEVENEWADQFKDRLAAAAREPGQHDGFIWYSGSRSPWDNPAGFSKAMGSSLASSIASASTAPGSSSGSGGGGFSGGGGGGGGGGGW